MKISNIDIVSTVNELNGMFIKKDGEQEKVIIKGLLNEKVSLKTKYWLQKLNKELNSHKEDFVESYKTWSEDKEDKDFMKFLSENEELALAQVDIKDYEFSIEDFTFETEYNYNTFIKVFIDKE